MDSLEKLLGEIKKSVIKIFNDEENKKNFINSPFQKNSIIQDLRIWLFNYYSSSDSLIHWRIDPKKFDNIVKNSIIRGGAGTIGYILKSGQPEFVNNTFDDPRGTVSIEDDLIGNKSWMGIPIGEWDGNVNKPVKNIECIISFYYDQFNFWQFDKKSKILFLIQKEIYTKFADALKLHSQIAKLHEVQNIFLRPIKLKDYDKILIEIGKVANKIIPYDFITLFEPNNHQEIKIKQISFNKTAIENRIKDLANWCSISEQKCNENCIINNISICKNNYLFIQEKENSNNQEEAESCLYRDDFLNLISPIHIQKISIGIKEKKYFFNLYLNKKIDLEIIEEAIKSLNGFFLPFIKEYKEILDRDKNNFERIKRVSETISIIARSFAGGIVANNNFIDVLKNVLTDILSSVKDSKYFSKDFKIKNKEYLNINSIMPAISNIHENISPYLLLIEFWEEKGNTFVIKNINGKSIMYHTFGLQLYEHSNISVIKRSIQNDASKIFTKYKPKFWANKNIISVTKSHYSMEIKDNSSINQIIWGSQPSPYLHFIIIHEDNFSKKVIKNLNILFKKPIDINNFNNIKIKTKSNLFNSECKFLYPEKDLEKIFNQGQISIAINVRQNQKIENEFNNIKKYTSNLVNYISLQKEKEFSRKAAIKSAVAAIMSRNGSHNIGSHILAAVNNNYSELPDDQMLFKYVQQRMDYIAQITTEIPEWSYSVLFVQDLMRRFYRQRHLLNYIASSEELSAYEYQKNGEEVQFSEEIQNKLIVNVRKKDLNSDKEKYIDIISPKLEQSNTNLLDITSVAIPGGIIGTHAFYTILENIIRNSAKHSWSNAKLRGNQKNLVITIDIEDDPQKDYVIFRIWDNISNVYDSNAKLNEEEKSKLAKKSLPDNWEDYLNSTNEEMEKTLPLHQRQNLKLMKSFVDLETGQLRPENWGLAEMKISAGYLKKLDVEAIGQEGKSILFDEVENGFDYRKNGIIRSLGIKDDETYHLGYEFCVPKPKEVLIVGINDSDIEELGINKEDARKKSIYLEKDFPEKLDYEYLIIYDENKFKIEDIYKYENFPARVFVISNDLEGNNKRFNVISKNKFIAFFIEKIENLDIFDAFKIDLFKEWLNFKFTLDNTKTIFINTIGGRNSESSFSINRNIILTVFKKWGKEVYDLCFKALLNGIISSAEDLVDFIEKGGEPCGDFSEFDSIIRDKAAENNIKDKQAINDSLECFKKFLNAYSKLNHKYEEDIETLPWVYTDKKNISTENNEVSRDTNNSLEGINLGGISITDNISKANIIYMRHGGLPSGKDKIDYFEALSGSQTYFSVINNFPKDYYLKYKLILQLLENALLKILIIDERMAKFYVKLSRENKEKFDNAQITIVNSFKFDRHEKQKVISSEFENYIELTDEGLKNSENSWDVLIIHQTILDEIFNNDTYKMAVFMEKLKKYIPLLVVTSGRGKPDKLPHNVKFLPFSNLEGFLMKEYHEKFLLTQILMLLIRERSY